MGLHFRPVSSLLLGGAWLLFGSLPTSSQAQSRDRFVSARGEHSALEARTQMERVLGSDDDPNVSAEAGIWLGQYEYALGRLESAHGYFLRAAQLAQDESLLARSSFWSTHTENLLASNPRRSGPEDAEGGSETAVSGAPAPETRSGARRATGGPIGSLDRAPAYELLAELARGDEQIRTGQPKAAIRLYLEAEGRAREVGRLGPLAYRVALTTAEAKENGTADPLFDLDAIESWGDELMVAPERGLVFAAMRGSETIAPPQSGSSSEFASPVSSSGVDSSIDSRKWGDGVEGVLDQEREVSVRQTSPRKESSTGSVAREDLFVIQLGAFNDRERAREEMERFTSRGLSVRLENGTDSRGDRVFRIRLGGASSRAQAEALAQRLLDGVSYQLVSVEP